MVDSSILEKLFLIKLSSFLIGTHLKLCFKDYFKTFILADDVTFLSLVRMLKSSNRQRRKKGISVF